MDELEKRISVIYANHQDFEQAIKRVQKKTKSPVLRLDLNRMKKSYENSWLELWKAYSQKGARNYSYHKNLDKAIYDYCECKSNLEQWMLVARLEDS